MNKKLGRPHRKRTELATELIALAADNFAERRFRVVGDNAYVNRSVVRPLPGSVQLIGRGRMDAALYEPAPKYNGRGRPRVKGRRLASPQSQRTRWRSLDVEIYGRPATVLVKVFTAVWYRVSYDRSLRFVVIRGWPGHRKDDVLVSTDLGVSASEIIQLYCKRWSIEETFGSVKGRLGFEDPHNRTEHAVQRTAPMALWSYSLVIVWYATWARRRRGLFVRVAPWYRQKKAPSFADMLATLRRQSWTLLLSDQARRGRLDQKSIEPLLDAVGYG